MSRRPDRSEAAAPAGAAAALAFERVTGGYGRGPAAVGPLDAAVRGGELVALVGPNGAGKSTLLRAALGGEVRVGGAVRLAGRVLAGDPPRPRTPAGWRARRLAWVPQAGGVRFGFSAGEVLAMARHAHGDAGRPAGREAVERAAERCGVEGLLGRPFASLSGGQQRRVLLARGLAQADGGAVLLADEPTAGMDPGRSGAAMAELRRAAQRGLAVVVTAHDLTEAWRYADRVWLLDHGRLVADGPPAEVLDDERLRGVYGVGFEAVAGEAVPGAARGGAVLTTG